MWPYFCTTQTSVDLSGMQQIERSPDEYSYPRQYGGLLTQPKPIQLMANDQFDDRSNISSMRMRQRA